MDFTTTMQNLALGIASGIFSSIIVSVVFYILNEFQTELNKANDMVYPLYGVIVSEKAYRITTNIIELDFVNSYFEEAVENFIRFEPWKFKDNLQTAMCQINTLITDGKYVDTDMNLREDTISEFSQKISLQLDIIQLCEKNFAQELIKRIFKNECVKVFL